MKTDDQRFREYLATFEPCDQPRILKIQRQYWKLCAIARCAHRYQWPKEKTTGLLVSHAGHSLHLAQFLAGGWYGRHATITW